jgi:hypothetical protein
MQDKDHVGGKFFPPFATFIQFFAWEGKTVKPVIIIEFSPAAHRVRLRTTNFGLARRTRRRMRPTRSIPTSTRNPNVMTVTAETYRKGVAQSRQVWQPHPTC